MDEPAALVDFSTDDPRQRVLTVAEQLFAEHGIEPVSLRQIGRAAGQGNHSVVQYYFGTKQGLVTSIIELRADRIAAERQRMLDELRTNDQLDLWGCVRVFVEPLAGLISGGDRTWYLRFLANAMDYSQMHAEWAFAPDANPPLRELHHELHAQAPGVPPALQARRTRNMALIVFRILAVFESDLASGGAIIGDRDQVTHDAISAATALLGADVVSHR